MDAKYPLGRICKVSDVSEAISFLANDEFASFITEITLPVDGGWRYFNAVEVNIGRMRIPI